MNDEFRFDDVSSQEGHLRKNGILNWSDIEMAIMISDGYNDVIFTLSSRIDRPEQTDLDKIWHNTAQLI